MSQVKFLAIALIALLINFSGKSVASSPVYILGQETPKSSPSPIPTPSPKSSPSPIPTPSPKSSPSPIPTPAAGSSKVILEKQAELTPVKSSVLPSDGSLYDEHRFEGTKGQTVVITLESTEFDTYLGVLDSEGELLGENDNATDKNTNSEVTITLSSNGVFLVIVNALQPPPKGKGKYSLTIRETIKK